MPGRRFQPYFRHGLLPQLIAFDACLRLGGVSRAAEHLALAQPTVSGLIRRLSETVVVVDHTQVVPILKALRKAGYTPRVSGEGRQ